MVGIYFEVPFLLLVLGTIPSGLQVQQVETMALTVSRVP
jgi:hypothetical protein